MLPHDNEAFWYPKPPANDLCPSLMLLSPNTQPPKYRRLESPTGKVDLPLSSCPEVSSSPYVLKGFPTHPYLASLLPLPSWAIAVGAQIFPEDTQGQGEMQIPTNLNALRTF